jgi:valyl-tRNA synthetase
LEDGEVKLHPKRFDNTAHWLNNIRDWNISRQLWWVNSTYFYGDGKEDFVVAESIEAALELAKVKLLTSHFSLLTLDVDALDTWFSSWLWPMSVLANYRSRKRRLQILLPNE